MRCLYAGVHITHGPLAAPRHLQLQSDSRTLPSPEREFVGHCMHAAEPASDL